MGRKINSRLLVTGKLLAQTPLHIGGYGTSSDTDLPLAQNGKGEWYVPGTSIAGVLRHWCEKNLPPSLIKEIFAPKRTPGVEEGHASFVLVEDATIENANAVLAEIRDGVGIDRFYGTAADKAKYDRAVLPRGTRLCFEMLVEIGKDHNVEEVKAAIGYLLEALQAEQLRFGAAKTRGLGRVKLADLVIREQSFLGFAVLDTLNKGGTPLTIKQLKNDSIAVKRAASLEIRIRWQPRLPVMVKAGYDGIGVDMLPLTSANGNETVALCLPGSSIKGVLRSHAERIMRTLLDIAVTPGSEFHEQFDGIPLVEELFGARNKAKAETGRKTTYLGLGALSIDDCYAKPQHQMSVKNWRAVERATVENDKSAEQWDIRTKLAALANVNFRINHHVAIDRWTGGASDGALYSVLAPTAIEWEEICLTLDFGRLEGGSQLPALMLLLLVLRDVAENRLPFGFATNRGMGEIAVEKFEFIGSGKLHSEKTGEQDSKLAATGETLSINLQNALSATVANRICIFAEGELKTQIQTRWKEWLEQMRKA